MANKKLIIDDCQDCPFLLEFNECALLERGIPETIEKLEHGDLLKVIIPDDCPLSDSNEIASRIAENL
jgi:hypothetical protein